MGKKYTKKETSLFGNEKEVHYEDGKKVGETKYRETFWGGKVQDHFDSSGNKIGETRREEKLFSDKAVHYNTKGDKIGYTKNDKTIFGNEIQKHYDQSGKQTGKSTYEEGLFGGRKKVHDGEYYKGSRKYFEESDSNTNNNDSIHNQSYGSSSIAPDLYSRQTKKTFSSDIKSFEKHKSSLGKKILKGVGFATLVAILFLVFSSKSSIVKNKSETSVQKMGNEGFYYTDVLRLEAGKYYQISWDEFSSRPYSIAVNGRAYHTYNYIMDNSIRQTSEPVFQSTIERPWKLRPDRTIEIRIGFTDETNYKFENVTGKLNNNEINIGGDLYRLLKVPNP